MTKDDLIALAEKHNATITRGYGVRQFIFYDADLEAFCAALSATQPKGCSLGCVDACKAKEHGCASECPALPWQPKADERGSAEPGELPPACRSIGGCALATAPARAGSEPVEIILRAMARNYARGHQWDGLDALACTRAADEIDRLRTAPARAGSEPFDSFWKSLPIPGEFDAMDAIDQKRWKQVVQMAYEARAGSEPGLREAVHIEAVATTRRLDDGTLDLDWLIEGGVSALECEDVVLYAADRPLTDDEGSGDVYLAATPEQPAQAQPAVEPKPSCPACGKPCKMVAEFRCEPCGESFYSLQGGAQSTDILRHSLTDAEKTNLLRSIHLTWAIGAAYTWEDLHDAMDAALAAAPEPEPEPIERNFCTRCGKRLVAGDVHTCTPPRDGDAQEGDAS